MTYSLYSNQRSSYLDPLSAEAFLEIIKHFSYWEFVGTVSIACVEPFFGLISLMIRQVTLRKGTH